MKTSAIFSKFLFLISINNILAQTTTEWPDHDERNSLENKINATMEIANGLLKNIGDSLPTFEEILNAPKQLIFGLPGQLIFDAISSICSTAIKTDSIKPKYDVRYDELDIQLRTECETFAYSLYDYDDLFKNEHFNRSKKVVILVTGWNSQPNNSDIVRTMQKAFLCRGDVNFLVLDAANYIDTLYTWAAYNAENVGYYLAVFLRSLLKEIPKENIHLIGHSLGANIAGYAGYHFQYLLEQNLTRITGLDPSRPCFDKDEKMYSLNPQDAEFVDIIHSNPGAYGQMEAIGDADFYTNGFDSLVPGCLDHLCSHDRSWQYYAESVYPENENNFPATHCSSLNHVRHGYCNGQTYSMGYAVRSDIHGKFFVEVKSSSPFGQNGDGQREKMYKNCGLCETEQTHDDENENQGIFSFLNLRG